MKHIIGFLKTPPLWKNEQFGLKQFTFPDIDLSSFKALPIPTHLRLGHQIEYIFKQLLDHSEHYDVLAHNIQIKRDRTTLGELDFIVEDVRFRESGKRKRIHIELTYKFYILDPSISEPIHRLMGPNRKDMFFTKMEKTRDKQLPLAYSAEGMATLEKSGIDASQLVQQTYFLGQLFTPFGQKAPSIRPLNVKAVVGFWIRFEDFKKSSFSAFQFYITRKYEWLHAPHLQVHWRSHYDILMDITLKHIGHRAPLVWIRKEDDTLEKCFVVWW